LHNDTETVEVQETDLDGDGTVDLVTTTSKRHQTLRFGPGVATSGWIKTEVEVGQCDEDHDGRNDWVAVTASERIHVDLDGDGSVDIISVTERVSHDFDGDGIADLVTTKILEEVVVAEEGSGEERLVTSKYERVDEPSAMLAAEHDLHSLDSSPEALRERIRLAASRFTDPASGPTVGDNPG
jgi:galactitol-specific phosphotransferase system IIB component